MTLLFAGIVAALVLMWRRLTAVEREVEYLREALVEARFEAHAEAPLTAPPPIERREEPAVV